MLVASVVLVVGSSRFVTGPGFAASRRTAQAGSKAECEEPKPGRTTVIAARRAGWRSRGFVCGETVRAPWPASALASVAGRAGSHGLVRLAFLLTLAPLKFDDQPTQLLRRLRLGRRNLLAELISEDFDDRTFHVF